MLVFIVAALGIFGVILVSVLERMREFSIMLAIGTPYKMVRNQILLEASFLGFIGFMAGAIPRMASSLCICQHGVLTYALLKQDLETVWSHSAILIADMNLYYFFQAFFAVLFATLLSVIWPLSHT